jgi:hypothetical protein
MFVAIIDLIRLREAHCCHANQRQHRQSHPQELPANIHHYDSPFNPLFIEPFAPKHAFRQDVFLKALSYLYFRASMIAYYSTIGTMPFF